MNLQANDKMLLLKWMRTKPFFQNLFTKLGKEKTITYYLKDKSPKRLWHILEALKRRFGNCKFTPSNPISN